jgi:uncharacterized membrane protein YbhN (UPF0104 family)
VGTIALAVGVRVAVTRLRPGQGLVSSFVRAARLDRLAFVRDRMGVVEDAEALTAALLSQRAALVRCFALGLLANLANFVEYRCLLAAFGLPAAPLQIAAAIVAAELARTAPVPAAVGALEAGQMWVFSLLGFPPDVGLAVGLVLRARDLAWLVPGAVYLLAQGVRSVGAEVGGAVEG